MQAINAANVAKAPSVPSPSPSPSQAILGCISQRNSAKLAEEALVERPLELAEGIGSSGQVSGMIVNICVLYSLGCIISDLITACMLQAGWFEYSVGACLMQGTA